MTQNLVNYESLMEAYKRIRKPKERIMRKTPEKFMKYVLKHYDIETWWDLASYEKDVIFRVRVFSFEQYEKSLKRWKECGMKNIEIVMGFDLK